MVVLERSTWFGSVRVEVYDGQSRVYCIESITRRNRILTVDVPCEIADISSSHLFVVAVCSKNTVYTFRADGEGDGYHRYNEGNWAPFYFKKTWSKVDSIPSAIISAPHTLITCTASTSYLIYQNEKYSSIIRLFSDDELVDSYLSVQSTVIQCPDDKRFVQVSSGNGHTVFLSDDGEVYTMGFGSRGELGCDSISSSDELVHVEALEGLNVIKVSAGSWHSVALTESNDVYVWGWNHCGQISKQEGEIEHFPVPLELEDSCVDIEATRNETRLTMRKGNTSETYDIQLGKTTA